MEKEKYTEKELEEKREELREFGMGILKGYLPKLALAYQINQEESGFGKNARMTVDNFLYRPTIEALDHSGYFSQALLSSRKNGKPLSGNISEEGITEKAAGDVYNAMNSLKVIDLKDYMKLNIPKKYEDKYIYQMLKSEDKNEKKLGEDIYRSLQDHFISQGISEAYSQRAGFVSKGLEKILEEAEKGKKSD